MQVSGYHKLPIAEKRAAAIAGVREPSVTCPDCDTQLMPVDLPAHRKLRCTGRREPGPGAKWLPMREAMEFGGLTRETLMRWVREGHVRSKGTRGDRVYLLRDLVVPKPRKPRVVVGKPKFGPGVSADETARERAQKGRS